MRGTQKILYSRKWQENSNSVNKAKELVTSSTQINLVSGGTLCEPFVIRLTANMRILNELLSYLQRSRHPIQRYILLVYVHNIILYKSIY